MSTFIAIVVKQKRVAKRRFWLAHKSFLLYLSSRKVHYRHAILLLLLILLIYYILLCILPRRHDHFASGAFD
jgi:hypothetical protein